MTIPHAYVADAIDWSIDEYELGDYGVVSVEDTGSLDWTEYSDSDWRTVTLHGRASVPEEVFDIVLTDDDSPADTLLCVQFESPNTQFVTRTDIDEVPEPDTSLEWEIELLHEHLHGRINVQPFVVWADDRDDPTPFYASYSRQRMADGHERVIQLDGQTGRGLDAEFVDFEDGLPGVAGDILYHVGGDNEHPTVYGNERQEYTAEVLDAKGFWHFSPLMRDTIAHWIGQMVVLQFALWAGADAAANGAHNMDESNEDPLNYDWQRNILSSLGPDLYDTDDPGEVASELAATFDTPDDFPTMLQNLSQAVQREIPAHVPLERYIEYEGPDHLGGDDE